jgi:transposase, IS30 family
MSRQYSHLSFEERALIQTQLAQGMKAGSIASGLNRVRSTILRELRRNGWQFAPVIRSGGRPKIAGGYDAIRAQKRAHRLAVQPRVERRLKPGTALWTTMLEYLKTGLSPQQISEILTRMPEPVRLSHETIYTALYALPRGELRASILALLRQGRTKRKPRSRGTDRRKPILNMTLIEERPMEVSERVVPGHWEGDTIKGKGSKSQVGTLVERTTLFVALVRLPDGRALTTAEGFASILERFDSQMKRSLTYDQGAEMAQHLLFSQNTGMTVYFAHPHSPWERGISENTNGLLRQYLPKGTDLSLFTQEQLDDIAWKLNIRPRKSLGWKCPAELFLPKADFDFVKTWLKIITPVALRS